MERCEGVLLFGSRKSFGSSVLRAFLVSTACFKCDEHSWLWVGGVDLSRKAPDLGSWGCTPPRADKGTPGVDVAGKLTSISRTAAVERSEECATLTYGEKQHQ